jgi:hypothetical protein
MNGKFAIFRINSQYLVEQYKCDIMITPLKPKFSNFKEKREVDLTLNEIRGIYTNFVYFPYDDKLIYLLKDN